MPTTQDIHYMFDMRGATIGTLTPINVSMPKRQSAGQFDSDATGGFILNIGDGLDFNPAQVPAQTWSALTNEKNLAILQQFPGFANILFDDMADGSAFDMATAAGVIAGGRGSFSLGDTGSGSTVTTNGIGLSGGPPAQGVLWFETFMYVPDVGVAGSTAAGYSDPKAGRFKRVLRPFENSSTFLQFDVSFNNGSSYVNNVLPKTLFNIPGADQGTTFKLRVTRKVVASPAGRVGIGGWALVY